MPQNPQTISYPIYTDVIEFFLTNNGFVAKEINVDSGYTRYKKGDISIQVDHVQTMTTDQVIQLLYYVSIPLSEFEEFVNNNSPSGVIKSIIKTALKTPALKRKK